MTEVKELPKARTRSSLTLAAIEFAVEATRTALGMSGAAGAYRAERALGFTTKSWP